MSDVVNNTKYVVGLSGGVDSVVLLHALANNQLSELTNFQLPVSSTQFIVAHLDHGIRKDSLTDERFARGVAGDNSLSYESKRVELGAEASEETARQVRYNFLRQCCKKYDAQLITAHHQDDLIETMVLNLIRGTSWRGLVSLNSDSDIIRPLLDVSKSQILDYAKKHNLSWHEDSTNSDVNYLRNYIRHELLPKMLKKDSNSLRNLLEINRTTKTLKKEIATELQNLIINYQLSNIEFQLPRYQLIMWPPLVAYEVIYTCLVQLDPDWHPSSKHIKRALHFIKTANVGKQLEVSKRLKIFAEKGSVQFKSV